MANGSNEWGVEFCRITFLEEILSTHKNVEDCKRDKDILFSVRRKKPSDSLVIVCVDEYTCGIMAVRKILKEFGQVDMIFVGGVWNSYTKEAKQYCVKSQIGLYNAGEMAGGLWAEKHWIYAKKDDKGRKIYPFKDAA